MGKPIHKLTGDEQIEVVKRIAWFWRDKDIVEWVKTDLHKDITKQSINTYRYSDNWKPHIENFREKYLNEVTEVACANKRVRLEELQRFYHKAIENDDTEGAINILKEFRAEMDKKVGDNFSVNLTQINNTQYNQLTDEELTAEINKTVKQLERAGQRSTE